MGRKSPTHEDAYSGPKAAKLAGISYRCVDTWARKGLIKPSLRDADGSGRYRVYSLRDVLALRVAKRLRQQGVSLKTIAAAARALRRGTRLNDQPLADFTFFAERRRVYVITDDDSRAIDVSHGGQLVLTIALNGLGRREPQSSSRIPQLRSSALLQRVVKL